MARKQPSLGELLFRAPWKVNVVLGILVFAAMRWGAPRMTGQEILLQAFAAQISALAPAALFVFAVFAAGSFWFQQHRRSLVDKQTGLDSLRALPWKQFEFLVAEAFHRQGYAVEYSLNRGADGGVDLTMRKDGTKTLVQCKQWKTQSIGAPVVREMFGLMHAESAQAVIIVTTGNFTRDAQTFAAGKPVQLMTGLELLELVKSVQTQLPENGVTVPEPDQISEPPACPFCGKSMVKRTSRRGANAGNQFWGCSSYPDCKGTRSC